MLKPLPELEKDCNEFHEQEIHLEGLLNEAGALEASIPSKVALLEHAKNVAVLAGKPMPEDKSIETSRSRAAQIYLAVKSAKLKLHPTRVEIASAVFARAKMAFEIAEKSRQAALAKALGNLDAAIRELSQAAGTAHAIALVNKRREDLGMKCATSTESNIRSPFVAAKDDFDTLTRCTHLRDDSNWIQNHTASGIIELCDVIEHYRQAFELQDREAAAKESKKLVSV